MRAMQPARKAGDDARRAGFGSGAMPGFALHSWRSMIGQSGAQPCPDWERCSYMSAKRNGRTSKLVLPFLFVLMHDHACDKIRTRDLLVRSQTLYPAELRAHKRFSQTQVLYYRREGQMSSINLNFFIPDVYRLCHLSKMCRTLRRRIHTWIPIEG